MSETITVTPENTETKHESVVDKVFDAAFAKAAQALVVTKKGLEASALWLSARARFVGELAQKLEKSA